MLTYAYILPDAIVYTLIQGPLGFDPASCYRGQLPDGQWVESPDDILPGDSFDGTDWIRAPRPVEPLTRLEFLRRFTANERIAIRASADPIIVDFISLLDMSSAVRTDDPDTIEAVGYFEQQGLISVGRGSEILT